MPCLLHANKQGYWIGSRGRHATLAEHSRAQGLAASRAEWPARTVGYALLGNSMALCIVQRLLFRILCRWEILCGPDPWESGRAQAELRRDAAAEGGPVPERAEDVPQWHPKAQEAVRQVWQRLHDPRRGSRSEDGTEGQRSPDMVPGGSGGDLSPLRGGAGVTRACVQPFAAS